MDTSDPRDRQVRRQAVVIVNGIAYAWPIPAPVAREVNDAIREGRASIDLRPRRW